MVEYYLKNIYFKNIQGKKIYFFPNEIVFYISTFLPYREYKDDIKNKRYLTDGLWYKRITSRNIIDLSRDEINYFDWYKIFHNKDYSILIKFENALVKKLLKSKTKEEIEKIHMDNLENCHIRNHMNFKSR